MDLKHLPEEWRPLILKTKAVFLMDGQNILEYQKQFWLVLNLPEKLVFQSFLILGLATRMHRKNG